MEQPELNNSGRLSYAAGYIGIGITERVLATWLTFYYLGSDKAGLPRLVPITMFGLAMVLTRVVDSVADPIVASLSDNCKSPTGRRTPFMLYAAIVVAASMVLLFFPPSNGASYVNLYYVTALLSIFYAAFTAYSGPYLALLPELARSQAQRVDLSTWQAIFSLMGTAIGMVVSGLLVNSFGYRGMAVILGLVSLIALYIPVFGLNEKRYARSRPSEMGMWNSFLTTLSNRMFIKYLLGNLAFWFGFNIISITLPYYVTVLMGDKASSTSLYLAITFVFTICSFPIVNRIAKKFGNRKAMLSFMAMDAILFPMIYCIGMPGTGIGAKIFGACLLAVLGILLSGLFVIPNAIVADITDMDEKKTGSRREAMFFGAQGFLSTASLGLSSLVATFLYSRFGYSVSSPLGIRLTGPIAGFCVILGIIAISGYRDPSPSGEK